MTDPRTILIADDDRAIRTVLSQALGRAGYQVRATSSAATLWRWVEDGEGDLVITDVVMPDENGLDLVPRIRRVRPEMRVIVMSAQSTFATAVKATQRGAFEYLPKPFDLKEVLGTVERALAAPPDAPPPEEAEGEKLPLIGRSAAMQEIYRTVARLTTTDLTVMVTGESGTGKELIARALHDYGKRRSGPFVAINMAAIPRELIEAELFGHERGAFTGALNRGIGRFEQAAGGTLFLDEIGDMPPEAQTRLLRVLQEGEFTTVGGRQPTPGAVSRRPFLSPECGADPPAAAARKAGRYPLARAAFSGSCPRFRPGSQAIGARGFGSAEGPWLARQCARIGKPDAPHGGPLPAGSDRRRCRGGRTGRSRAGRRPRWPGRAHDPGTGGGTPFGQLHVRP